MIKGFLTNLGKYNEGELVGEWVEFPLSEDEEKHYLELIGISDKPDPKTGAIYEEYFFTDWEPNIDLGEFISIEKVNEIAEALEDSDVDEDVILEIAQETKRPIEEILNADIISLGSTKGFSSLEEAVGYFWADAVGGVENLPEETIRENIDLEAFGRDERIEFNQFEEGGPETAGEYWCNDEDASDYDIGSEILNQLGPDGITKEAYERYFDFEKFGHDIIIGTDEIVELSNGDIYEVQF